MAVSIEAGSGTRLRRSPTGFVVRVDAGDAAQAAASREALARTRLRLLGLDDPDPDLGLGPADRNDVAYASHVMATPTGGVVYVDGGHVSPRRLVEVLDWAVEDLHQHGVDDAVVAVPGPSAVFEQLEGQPSGPRLSLTHLPPASLVSPPAPAAWGRVAAEWLVDDARLVAQGVHALVSSQDFPIGPSDIATVLDLEHAGWIGSRSVLVGDPASGVRFVTYECSASYVLTLGSTGSATTDAADLERRLVRVAEDGAVDLDYAWLEVPRGYPLWLEPSDPFGLASGDSGRPPRANHMDVIDEVALDAFSFQVLGPGHLRRLGDLPDARPLAGGRVSLRLGSTTDWATGRRVDRLRRRGRRKLRPILLDEDSLFELSKARLLADMAERQRLREQA